MKIPILNLKGVHWPEQRDKIREEFKEFEDSRLQTEHELSELLDLIQASIGFALMNYSPEQIKDGIQKHYDKLASRDKAIIGDIDIKVSMLTK